MDYESPARYSFLQRIIGVISGNSDAIQDLKQSGKLIDAGLAFVLSVLGVIGIFIVNTYLSFLSLKNVPEFLTEAGFSPEIQNVILQSIGPNNFSGYLAGNLFGIILLVIGLAMFWLISSLLIHLFALGIKGQARFTNILVFEAFLLPLSILFGLILLLPNLAGLSGNWILFFVLIILAIILIIILARAMIIGISEIYSITKQGAAITFLLTAMIFAIVIAVFWWVII